MIRIGLFTLDSVASNRAIRMLIERHSNEIAFVGLSCRGIANPVSYGWREFRQRGANYLLYVMCNFALPRWIARNRNRPSLSKLCRRHGIASYPISDVNHEETRALLRKHRIDLIVSCYFDQIFAVSVLAQPDHGALNVHTSLLPDNRGAMPVVYGLLAKPPRLGVTVHRIDAHIDTGDILAQKTCVPQAGDTVLRSMTDLHEQGVELLSGVLSSLEAGQISARPQTGGSYDGLPDRDTLKALRRRGIRLVDFRDIKTAFKTPIEV